MFLLLMYKCFPIFQLPSVFRLILEDFHDAQLLVSVFIQSSSEERLRWCEEGRLQLPDRWPEQVVGILRNCNNDNVDNLFVKELQTIPLILKMYI